MSKVSIISFYILLLGIWGCSTTNHAILPTQAYHDITSHYNAYFNANEKLKNTLMTAEQNHKDKFDSVISVYAHTDAKEFASYSGDFDDVVKRSTQAIQYHDIANWSDDHMLLIGKANFLKGDYDKASSSFKYITTQYKDGVDYVKVKRKAGKKVGKYVSAKRKKKKPQVKVVAKEDGTKALEKVDNRPEKSIWIHTPARSEALIWLIKTYTRQGRYDEASSVITYTRNDDNFYKDYDPQVELVDADLQVTRKNYAGAITPLEKYLVAKKVRKKKRLKVRPYFVLAQCYEAIGNNKKAIENYRNVLKSRPNYDMEFYAKLKMAKLGRGGSSDNAAVRSLLAKMARDGKYKEYWDQIYYELALLSIQEKNIAEGKKFLNKSIAASSGNDDQKAQSYLMLAELDYQAEAYVSAKFYYDTTLTLLDKENPRYAQIDERNKMLGSLVEQLTIIATEDSLQKLAAMPEDQRRRVIREAVAQKEKAEEDKKSQDDAARQQAQLDAFQNGGQQGKQQTQQQGTSSGSTWYFYNTSARATGYNDFVKKWGKRKLEDNWRRKNKASTMDDDLVAAPTDSAVVESTAKVDDGSKGTPEEQMMAGIPATAEKLDQSNERLSEAYYNAGTIYKDGLESYPKAEEMFEAAARVKNNKLLLESYYNMYLIANKRGDNGKAETYKNKILTEFPESTIAKVLRDPNYIKQLTQKDAAVNNYYQDTYNDYAANELDSAWYKAKMSDAIFKPNPLTWKFELLTALILARQNKLTDYVQALQKISNKSTDLEVKETATNLLGLLNKSSLPQIDLSKDTAHVDSLNKLYEPYRAVSGKPDTSFMDQFKEAREKAIAEGKIIQKDTSAKQTQQPVGTQPTAQDTSAKGSVATNTTTQVDTATNKQPVTSNQQPVVQEDTTSPYLRSDEAVHYFVVYIKDPETPQSAVTSTLAKINAFNSTQFESKRLQAKQVLIDSKNKLINVRQFKNKADALEYYNVVKSQNMLYSDMKPEQYALTVISVPNFSTLLSEKDIELYINKFFRRVYK